MRTFFFLSLLSSCLLIPALSHDYYPTKEDIEQEVDQKTLNYGATVRLQNQQSKFHLHSHDLKYGTGSNQQSVTGMRDANDYNSLWTIKSMNDAPVKYYNEAVKCGDVIRLEHALTKKNLHSHDERSPVSNKFEVSAFGDDGHGDGGDNWQILCEKESEGTVMKNSFVFYLQHYDTKRYLFSDSRNEFNHRNCGQQCPIIGQLEVAADSSKSNNARWKVTSGLFYMIKDNEEAEENKKDSDSDSNSDDKVRDDDL